MSMRPLKLYPSRGPIVFKYTAVALLAASLVVQFDGSKKHITLALAWLALVCAYIIKDLFDYFIYKKYDVAIEISDINIQISRVLTATGVTKVEIKDIERVTRDSCKRLLLIILRNGATVYVDISTLKENDIEIALNHLNQGHRMR